MAGTPTIVTRILNRISSGSLNTLLPGGIYTRPIKREGNGKTLTAFDADGDPLPAAVVMDDPDATDRVMGGMRLQVTGLWRRTG